jgi:hypothetical protein
VKRLRLCVADNEAMRGAFSLLRVREAEEAELVRMLGECLSFCNFLNKGVRAWVDECLS